MILIKLILAHLLGDFVFQPAKWVAHKEKNKVRSKYLYWHLAVHGLVLFVLFSATEYLSLVLITIVVHGIIDLVKLYFQDSSTKLQWFFTDQILHLVSLVALALLFSKDIVMIEIPPQWWYVVTGLVFVTVPSSILIRQTLRTFHLDVPQVHQLESASLTKAGTYIGMLERFLVVVFIVSGHLEAVGFVLAAKSIFRYNDLAQAKQRKLTEYVLIGTFLSFTIAVLTGIIVQYLM